VRFVIEGKNDMLIGSGALKIMLKREYLSMIATKISRVSLVVGGCLAALLFASVTVRVKAQTKPYTPWVAPDDARAVKNPLKKTAENLAAGQETFRDNCEVCHGPKGDGNGPTAKTLTIKPANFTDPKLMSMETDGSLFWKMSKGRGAMPTWEDQLSETERWQLVLYIRSLGAKAAEGGEKKSE